MIEMTNAHRTIKPFERCPSLDGYHCQTNSLAKIFYHHGHPLSEDMFLGLGAGMGFIYWRMQIGDEKVVFIGGRGNNKEFFSDVGRRTGVTIRMVSTTSVKRAESHLLGRLVQREPVMLFGDMGLLPWFEFPVEYHFGGHTFTVCGFDGKETVLASDMDQSAAGLKKGFYHAITLERLRAARSSPYKPFPPKNAYLEFDFARFHSPGAEDVWSAVEQAVDAHLNPPIKNMGVKGIRHAAKELVKWPALFDERALRMNLFNLYIFIEIGGTGGGCFRYMYARFLNEAAAATGNVELAEIAAQLHQSGALFSDVGQLFMTAETATDIDERLNVASSKLDEIARTELDAFNRLAEIAPSS
jgi:hypothetical protein